MVTELNDGNWQQEVIDASTPVIVDFWAEWCGPCKMMAPEFEAVSKEYEGKLKFAKIDTQAYPTQASSNAVTGIPCLIVFNHGKEVDRIVGFSPRDQLKQKIEVVLSKI